MTPAGGADPVGDNLVIEAFDPEKHDRRDFSCGVDAVDNYFHRTAGKLSRADNIRLFVAVTARGRIAGFFALNAHTVRYEELPPRYARTRPGHGTIPAAYIAMIGRDQRFRGTGLGAILLADALKRLAAASQQLGIAVVLLDILDCGNPDRVEQRRQLYRHYGFEPLPSNPMRLFLPMATVRRLLEEH